MKIERKPLTTPIFLSIFYQPLYEIKHRNKSSALLRQLFGEIVFSTLIDLRDLLEN